jgi:hypothetical protein
VRVRARWLPRTDEIFDCVASNENDVIVGAADGMLHMFPLCSRAGRATHPVRAWAGGARAPLRAACMRLANRLVVC